jgi:proto-oncogene C-crk
MSMNGQWEGELSGKMGHFPFTHVEFIDSESGIEEDHS